MYLIHLKTSQTCLRLLQLCSLRFMSFVRAEPTFCSRSACVCLSAPLPPMRAQFHSRILEMLIIQHHTVFPRFLFTSTHSTADTGSKAGIVDRLFNKTTMLNLHFTLKDPSGVLTKLSHNHFMAVYTQPCVGGTLKHPPKPFASTEVGIWSPTKSLKLSSTHGLFLC